MSDDQPGRGDRTDDPEDRGRSVTDQARCYLNGHLRIDAAEVAAAVPDAVLDPGSREWPIIIDERRLIPDLWLAHRQAAEVERRVLARLDALEVAVAELTARVAELERR